MGVGKKFESTIDASCEKYANIFIHRLRDVVGYSGSVSIGDHYIYRKPNMFIIEEKTNKGISMSISEEYDDDGNLTHYGRLNYKQIEMMKEAIMIDGIYAGYIIEFRADKNNPHGTYYISTSDMLDYISNPNRQRKSVSQSYLKENGIIIPKTMKSNVWTVKEQELLLENKTLTANECYDKVKDTLDRTKGSIKSKFYQVRKNGISKPNQYITYEYDIDWLLDEIIRKDMRVKILNNVTDIQCEEKEENGLD